MVNKESVKQRLEREGEGISFTEFTYMLLQSLDFAELYKTHNCTLQIGGSDQWGNITGGVDLTRRQHGGQVFGMTLPLVTKADGTKFGKTESGTVWLSAAKTSPYAFYQFWLTTADADAYKFLKYFTFLSVEQIDAIEQTDKTSGSKPQAQAILAREVTQLVHGEAGLQAALRITDALFCGELTALTLEDFTQLAQDGLPASALQPEDITTQSLAQILTTAGLVQSGKQVKDALNSGSLWVNGRAVQADQLMDCSQVFSLTNSMHGKYFMLKLGKKKHHLFFLA
jgi:tyrosyl-tRNA synthetase